MKPYNVPKILDRAKLEGIFSFCLVMKWDNNDHSVDMEEYFREIYFSSELRYNSR